MNESSRFHKMLNVIILLSLVVQPLLLFATPTTYAASAQEGQQTSPIAPSDLALDLPVPDVPLPESMWPDVDPNTWAFDDYLPVETGFIREPGLVGVEPFMPNPIPQIRRPTAPQVPNPVPEIQLSLPGASSLEALLEQEEPTEEEEVERSETSSESVGSTKEEANSEGAFQLYLPVIIGGTEEDIPTSTPTIVVSSTPTVMPSSTPSPTSTVNPTNTPTNTPIASATSTPTVTPSSTPSPTSTVNPTNTPIASATSVPSATNTPTAIVTNTPVATITATNPPAVTETATNTPAATATATNPPVATATNAPAATATHTPANTPTATATNTPTNTPTATATNTPTNTPTTTATNTPTATATNTPAAIQSGVGGTVSSSEGEVEAAFSAASTGQDLFVQYEPISVTEPITQEINLAGPAFSITAWGQTTRGPVTDFPPQVEIVSPTVPITDNDYFPAYAVITPSIMISVSYNDVDVEGLDLRTLSLYSRQDENDEWRREPTSVYQDQNLMVAEVDHLTEFVPMAGASSAITSTSVITKRIALDPDDDVGHATWPGVGTITELPKNVALAEGVKAQLESTCQVEVLVTRDGGSPFVSRSSRANQAVNFDADMFVTLAFNALKGYPWGISTNGGVIGWARNGQPNDDALVTEVYNRMVEYTGRPHTRPVQHPSIYGDFNSLPADMTYAHLETLFLDHNYDWPVINTGFSTITDTIYVAVRTQLEAQGMTCIGPGGGVSPLPAPPSEEQKQKWRDLGNQNYQKYGADPVSFSTGNYIYQHNLFVMPNVGGLDVDMTFTFNAQDGRDGMFGYGWAFPYAARTQMYSDDSVSVLLHDGRTYHYEANGDAYDPPAGVHDTLERTDTGWTWTALDGTVLTFEEKEDGLGVMTEWRDRRDNALAFTYHESGEEATTTRMMSDTTAATFLPLASLTDNSGRTITFEVDGDNHITSMSLPDSRTFAFTYSDGNLTEITDANSGTRSFEYDDQKRMTKHYDPENIMYLENIYDDEDRVVEQVDASGSHLYMTYTDGDNGETLYSDNLGHETRYEYDELNRVTAVVDALGHREEMVYDDQYNMTSFTDKRGNSWTYTYDERGNMLTETDPLGNVMRYSYNAKNDLTSLTDALGRTTSFTYDAAGNLLQTERPDSTSISYTYDAQGQLASMTDANSNTTTYSYDQYGNLTEVVDALGNRTSYEYDQMGRQSKMTDANGHVALFEYDGNDNITKITDPKGAVSTFEYDKNDNLVRMVDRLGRATTYAYDENLKLIRETNPEGETTTYDYDLMYNLISSTDALDNTMLYRYDATYQLIEIEDALGGVSKTAYDANGNVISLTDARSHATTFEYDSLNRMVKMTDALSNQTTYAYDAVGNLTSESNARGAVTQYQYDQLDRITQRQDALNGEWLSAYDPMGNLTTLTDANAHTTTFEYDAAYRLVKQTDAKGNATTFAYDKVGNRTKVTDALGRVTTLAYDENDNLTKITDALAGETTFSYDAEDNVLTMSNAIGQTTRYEYDDVNRVTKMIENHQAATAASADVNVTTEYAYDDMGNLLTLTDANGNPTTYQYDALYRVIREEDAENQVTLYEYDAVHNLTKLTNPRNHATSYAYDGLDRLITVRDAQSNIWQYAYDAVSNLIAMTDPLNVVTHYDYDLLDRMSGQIENYVDGGAKTVDQNVTTTFEYDVVGNLRIIHDPRGNYQTEHRYDAVDNRILTIDAEDGETEFGYDAVYNLTSVTDGNDHQTSITYDALNRQTAISNAENHTVQFAYDAIGNLLTLTDARNNATTFTYDGMNRVILRVDALAGEWEYSYDAMGNLLGEVDANDYANNTYSYDKVYRLLSSTDAEEYVTSFTYDQNGNRLSQTDGNSHTTTYTYDELDRLASMRNAENETTQYQYDPLGNQTRLIEADGIVTGYDYDPLYRLITVTENYQAAADESADVNVDTHYGYDEVGNLLTILNAEEHQTQFSYDGLNRLIQEVDAEGYTWDYEYDHVGNRTVRVDALRNRTEYSYYSDDELQEIAYYDDTTVSYTYDENNNRLTMVDSLGTTTWVYDALNRVTDVTDPFNRHLGYGYDAVGNRTSLEYADGNTVSYSYYDNNWLHRVTDPATNVTTYTRDGVGQVTRTDNPNSTVSEMTYDKANRLLTLSSYQVGGANDTISAFTYTYNDVGHRTQMVAEYSWRNPSIVTSSYTYDGLRRLIRDEDSEGVWTTYEFDRVGNRLQLKTNDDSQSARPFDEKTLVYSYNAINQLETMVGDTHPGSPGLKREENLAQPLHAFEHEVSAQRGKHISEAAADDLLAMAQALIDDLYDRPYPDETEVTDEIEAIRNKVIAYRDSNDIDNNGIENSLLVKLRLVDEANNGADKEYQTTTFTYDANGNRINKQFPGPQGPAIQGTDYSYNPENRLIVAQDYQMNNQGNRQDRAVSTLEYDGDQRRLVKEYDPKTGNGGQKRVEYIFDGLDPVSEYYMWNGQRDNYYRGDLNRIITSQHFPDGTQGQMYWYHYDGLGSTSGLTKHNGNSHHNYRYEPYGQIELPNGNFTDPHNHYTFTGQEWDENIEVYEFYARSYDPSTGTWLQQDTYRGQMNVPQSLHRYGYVGNNPTNLIDIYGYYWGESYVNSAGGWLNDHVAQPLTDAAEWTNEEIIQPTGRGILDIFVTKAYAPTITCDVDCLDKKVEEQRDRDRDTFVNQWVFPIVETGECINGDGGCGTVVIEGAAIYVGAKAGKVLAKGGAKVFNGARRYLARKFAKEVVEETTEKVVKEVVEEVVEETTENVVKKGLDSFARASEFGIQPYNALRKVTKGTGLEAHHLIEKRFAEKLGLNANKMSSVALTKEEHQLFTNAWRQFIPYKEGTINATKDEIWTAAQQIYKDYPELLEAARKTLGK